MLEPRLFPAASDRRPWWHAWVAWLLLAGVMLAIYGPALKGGLVWDDAAWTTDLNHLQSWAGLWRMWTEPTALQQYYPMAGTSFWLDRQLWGLWTLPYHVENVLIHALSAVLLWRVLCRLEVPGAWLAGLVFACHPVMVESVAWITERKNVLSLAFMLGAMLAYLSMGRGAWGVGQGTRGSERDRGRGKEDATVDPDSGKAKSGFFYGLALVLSVLALLSKITAYVFAPSLLLIAWWQQGRLRWKQDVRPTVPFFLITLALGSLIWWLETHHVGAKGKDFTATTVERVISAGRSFWFYPWKLLWPTDLCFLYPDWRMAWRGTTPRWHEWLWPVSAGLFIGLLWLGREKIGRGPLAAVLFYAGALLPVCGLLNVYGGLFAPVWDHWIYVPALGILLPVCALIAVLAGRVGKPWALPLTAALLAAPLAVQSWRLAGQYQSMETLWLETLRRNPDAWLAANNHGSALVTARKLEEAVAFFKQSLRSKPDYAEAWNNLGGALVQQGKFEESLDAYRQAIALDNEIAPYTRHNMGNALLTLGRTDEAMEQFRASLAMEPDYEEALNSLGAALTQLGRVDEAIEQLQHALRVKPDYHQAHNNLGSALQNKGDLDGALAAYEKAAALAPSFVEARFNLGELLYKKGDIDGAIGWYEKVTGIKPDHAKSHYNLGLCFTEKGRMTEAEAAYRKAIEIDPAYASAHNNLANNLLNSGQVRAAIPHFEQAIKADAQQLPALNNLAWVLATETDPNLRDGVKAVQYARQAAELTKHEHPVVLSTLAAALAETSQFNEAAATARQAHGLASRMGDASLAGSLENYARLYEARQPLRIERKRAAGTPP